jgi:hypothetical protein
MRARRGRGQGLGVAPGARTERSEVAQREWAPSLRVEGGASGGAAGRRLREAPAECPLSDTGHSDTTTAKISDIRFSGYNGAKGDFPLENRRSVQPRRGLSLPSPCCSRGRGGRGQRPLGYGTATVGRALMRGQDRGLDCQCRWILHFDSALSVGMSDAAPDLPRVKARSVGCVIPGT